MRPVSNGLVAHPVDPRPSRVVPPAALSSGDSRKTLTAHKGMLQLFGCPLRFPLRLALVRLDRHRHASWSGTQRMQHPRGLYDFARAAVTLGFVLAFSSGCNQSYFSPVPASSLDANNLSSGSAGSASSGPSCSTVLQNTTENLRIMFMVDNSGSTATTDPGQHYRDITVQDFLQQYQAKTNFTYFFGWFSGIDANIWDDPAQTWDVNTAQAPFGGPTALSDALSAYQQIPPGGSTPYNAAFASISGAIQTDEAAGNHWDYVVVFMSDGMPTDLGYLSGSSSDIAALDAELVGIVNNLKATAAQNGTSKLTLSTVYFGPEGNADPGAIEHLQDMATAGNGQFVDTNLTTNLQIADLITVPGTVCH